MKIRIMGGIIIGIVLVLVAVAIIGGLYPGASGARSQATVPQAKLPRPEHVVIVIEENKSYTQIIGSAAAPYINTLASQGASLTNMHAETHPSEPDYLALFAGSTFGISSDACPNTFADANLASTLTQAGASFAGYSESMPVTGYTGCFAPANGGSSAALYARKHNPWVNFTNVPASQNLSYSSFPTDYSKLPTISFVIPNQLNDMHSASIGRGDSWLKVHLDGYAQWAKTHNSLLIVTWDEDDGSKSNQIPTIFVGSVVKIGLYSPLLNHYSLLRTLEDMYGLPYLQQSASVTPITGIWQQR
ncbi:alkaline phosphatase family protein [Dictyobacter arantiisoli]|uniref:Acid phosphatase n=1 Tax=Dictyobacter arantiisoli TaxID=2014874 RepID=A0A5A5TB58_9CHLR|nr:alkaline phosphatase family protein [Dictyobacter arantiisoli]GCF08730.1 acid phosphatase [Dictyobacter arantiisoli]